MLLTDEREQVVDKVEAARSERPFNSSDSEAAFVDALCERTNFTDYKKARKFVAELVEAVNSGAALLDKKKPDWIEKINVGAIDLASGTNCILGQVYGAFGNLASMMVLGGGREFYNGCSKNGFIAGAAGYEAANLAWRELILRRKMNGSRELLPSVRPVRRAWVPWNRV